ncbi:MAG: DHH family phosphoesterase, partial [Clostridia bacterium]
MIVKNECKNLSLAQEIATKLEFDINLAKIVANRNINTIDDAVDFIYPKLDNLSNIDNYVGLTEVAARIQLAIDEKQTVIIYGDYDCDGICATSILFLFLKSKGVKVTPFLPSRFDNGYGLNIECLEELVENLLPDLLITVDCGISNIEEVEYCNEVLGVDVIVTDHHTPPTDLPQCLIFNPKLSNSDNVFVDLCGAGIALRLVEKLSSLAESKKYFDIACLATVADVVPLVGDNRIITYFGLKSINSGFRKGLDLLIKSNQKQRGEITSSDIAFGLAPKINSVGRLGDANKVLGLFCESDRFLLDCLVDEINKTNEQRQQLTADLVEFCNDKLQGYDFDKQPIIILYNAYWEEGVLGITASKIVGEFNRPTILLTKTKDGQIKGSGRSINGIDLYQLLEQGKQFLIKFGGHKMACGLSLEEKSLQALSDCLNNFALSNFDKTIFETNYVYDGDIADIVDINSFCRQLSFLEPYG